LYAGATSFTGSSEIFQGLFKSVDGATKWFAINTGLEPLIGTQSYITSLIIDSNNSDTLYIGTMRYDDAATGYGIFRSTDGGSNWTSFNVGLPSLFISSMAITSDNQAIPYAIAGDGIFKFINNRWVRLPDLIVPPGPVINTLPIRALAIDPTNPAIIY